MADDAQVFSAVCLDTDSMRRVGKNITFPFRARTIIVEALGRLDRYQGILTAVTEEDRHLHPLHSLSRFQGRYGLMRMLEHSRLEEGIQEVIAPDSPFVPGSLP